MSAIESPEKPAVVMYTQFMCGYCSAARDLLEKKGVRFDEINVTLNSRMRREMMDRSGRSTVPQIFIDEQPIGGFDDMAKLDADGKLDGLLGLE
jgi:glutaredoxin 3